ncbi:MAG: maleate isomerase [Gammaproteobacteria bacterium]|jgi:maleate isomerase
MKLVENLPFQTDSGIANKASIGLIVLATDYTIEYEWQQVFKNIDGVALYHSRIYNENEVTPETLRAMAPQIADCAKRLTPGTPVDVIAYGCTSATMAIGEQPVFDSIKSEKPEALCTTPITAVLKAMDAFKAKRIAVLTPYSASVNKIVAAYIEDRGFEVPIFGSFNEGLDSTVARITLESVEAGLIAIVEQADVDAAFISCTSVRAMDIIKPLEEKLGIPITSSNHAMAWDALRLAGIKDKMPQFGSLYTL